MPTSPRLFLLADAHEQAGMYVEAEALWRRALDRHPDHPVALARLSLLLRAAGRIPEALPLLDRLCLARPD
ncbi:MAG: tetratricopeptide repeat protein, partial [Alphaproteobacteria bacterium]|nr:tetratricopeptide repeat protein [Alphaproteobacteria bacterium]